MVDAESYITWQRGKICRENNNNLLELRRSVYKNPEESSDYREDSGSANEIPYAHPDYYRSVPRATQSADPYIGYPEHAGNGVELPQGEYRGPQSMEGYTIDAGVEQREAAARGHSEGGNNRNNVAGLGGALFALGAMFLKFGIAGITALISIGFYALLYGWQFAIGLVAQLFIHEMGHAIAMKIKGIPVGGMIFIPMLGAAVTMKQMPQNARDEAEVGIAGPIAGTLAASVCLVLAQGSPDSVWAPLAYFGFFINLFNLVPIVPFDGGRVVAAIDRRVWILGFLGLLGFTAWTWINGNFSPWLLFFVFMAGSQLWSRRATPNNPQEQSYYNVPIGMRISLTVLYFGLIAVLVLGMSMAHSLMGMSPY